MDPKLASNILPKIAKYMVLCQSHPAQSYKKSLHTANVTEPATESQIGTRITAFLLLLCLNRSAI